MRMFAQDRAFYREIRVDGTERPEAPRRLELLERVALARRKGLRVADALEVAGLSPFRALSPSLPVHGDLAPRRREPGCVPAGCAKSRSPAAP